MATTHSKLQHLESNLDESIGVRQAPTRSKLSPVPSAKDVGRRPLKNAARISIEQVIPDPAQPRMEFSPDSIDRLARSIKEQGQLAPIRVRWSAQHNKWIIVCGERRWRAIRMAGIATIDCCFIDGDLPQTKILEQQMIENLLREDLSPIEQAKGFSALMESNGWNGKQLAEALHVPASTVSRALSLLDLPLDVQEQVDLGKIAARSAYEISKVPDVEKQRDLAARAATGMTLAETKGAVRTRPAKKRKPRTNKKLEFIAENGWQIIAVAPKSKDELTYHHLLEAIDQVAEEVNLRIDNNIRMV